MTPESISSIAGLKKALKRKSISVSEVFDLFQNKAKLNKYNEFITLAPKEEERIKQAQKKIDKGEENALTGVPIAIKDIFLTKGIKTTVASRALENFIPSTESHITQSLLNEGALNIGKTNMDEFAMGSTSGNSFFGKCFNPNPDPSTGEYILNPGGSSGGSAISVAAGSSIVAIGTDTGGSVRQPAALCGVFGMKPSYGTCSRQGIVAYSSSLDQAGVFANNVQDIASTLNIISSFDSKDTCMVTEGMRNFRMFDENISKPIKGMRIAIIQDGMMKGVEPDVLNTLQQAAKKLEGQGAIIESNVEIKQLDKAIVVYYVVSTAECFSNLACFDGIRYGNSVDINDCQTIEELYFKNRNEIFGEEVKRRICVGAYVLSKEHYDTLFLKAAKVRSLIKCSFTDLFRKYDAVLMPTTSEVAQRLDVKKSVISTYLNDLFTVGPSCAGLPAISVPFGKSKSGLPIGVQIVCEQFDDHKAIQIANSLMPEKHSL